MKLAHPFKAGPDGTEIPMTAEEIERYVLINREMALNQMNPAAIEAVRRSYSGKAYNPAKLAAALERLADQWIEGQPPQPTRDEEISARIRRRCEINHEVLQVEGPVDYSDEAMRAAPAWSYVTALYEEELEWLDRQAPSIDGPKPRRRAAVAG